MKQVADAKKHDKSFNVGDNVLVKLQPYRQTTVAVRGSNKLSAQYFGPFHVLKRIGQVAYKLAFPNSSRIHDVFHISLLKPFRGTISDQTLPLPPEIMNFHPVLEPYLVLQERQLPNQDMDLHQILV